MRKAALNLAPLEANEPRPVAFSDNELETVLDCASVVPVRLRHKYLKGIAEKLPDNDIERVISGVLAMLDKASRNAEKQRRCVQRRKAKLTVLRGATVSADFLEALRLKEIVAEGATKDEANKKTEDLAWVAEQLSALGEDWALAYLKK